MQEPLEDYLEAFDEYQGHVEELLETTVDLAQFSDHAFEIVTNPRLLEAFRYLAAPPISSDDLKILADCRALSANALRANPTQVQRILSIVRQVIDRRRFPWIVDQREPTEAERNAAIIASAALMAASRAQTNRRSSGKRQQEMALREALLNLGFNESGSRKIPTIALAPAPGHFSGESVFGTRKADLIVRLWDHRVMPIECKVSNSSTNSVKRLNNDAAVKAESWRTDFGRRQVVPTAVLSGVYKLHNLLDAQDRGLTLFWSHAIDQLTAWISKTRPTR